MALEVAPNRTRRGSVITQNFYDGQRGMLTLGSIKERDIQGWGAGACNSA
jgi:hypothetical protein